MAVVNWIIPGIRYRDNRRSLPEYFTFLNWSIWNHKYQDVIFVGLSWVTWSRSQYNYLSGAHLRSALHSAPGSLINIETQTNDGQLRGLLGKIRRDGGCGCLTIRPRLPLLCLSLLTCRTGGWVLCVECPVFSGGPNKTNTPKLSLKKRNTKSSSKNTIFRPVLYYFFFTPKCTLYLK